MADAFLGNFRVESKGADGEWRVRNIVKRDGKATRDGLWARADRIVQGWNAADPRAQFRIVETDLWGNYVPSADLQKFAAEPFVPLKSGFKLPR